MTRRFVWIGHDGDGGPEGRARHRPAHLAGLEGLDAQGRIQHAGPLLDEAGQPCGSVIVFDAEDLDEARAIAARDPYVVEGVFARHEVYETRVVFPKARD